MNQFWKGLSERDRLLVVSLLVCTPAIFITYFLEGLLAGSIVVCALFFFFSITKSVWRKIDNGRQRIQRYSLFFVTSAATLPWWEVYIRGFVESTLMDSWPENPKNYQFIIEASPYFTLILLILVILLSNYWMRDKTGMVMHPIPVDEGFQDFNFKQSLNRFQRVVRKTLLDINLETHWTPEYFTALEAEAEIKYKGRKKSRVTDLLKAIKEDHITKVFLVLGDPGAGKSVALRTLCYDLLAEVDRTGKVPLYIDLKEWGLKEKWTKANPPTTSQLRQFILNQLLGKDVFTDYFLSKYYYKMLESGRFFLILDSFDEIPMVHDEEGSSWLIDRLSEIIYHTLLEAGDSRGILASRFFRRPSRKFNADTTLVIRPFSERKIAITLKKSGNFGPELFRKLFSERSDLIPVIRNPLSNALLSSYTRRHKNELPPSKASLFSDFLLSRIENSLNIIKHRQLSSTEVIEFAKELALLMYNDDRYGLEIPLEALKEHYEPKFVEVMIFILVDAKVGRLRGSSTNRFSFVHRRFYEYLLSQVLLSDAAKVNKWVILSDPRWRDALVMYCEIAPENSAIEIAEYCWKEIRRFQEEDLDLSQKHLPQFMSSLRCLRFLIDAFRSRKECLVGFQVELEMLLEKKIKASSNLLEVKLMVEAIGILNENQIDRIIEVALFHENQWISETAITSCIYLQKVEDSVRNNFLKTIQIQYHDFELFAKYKKIISPLEYSEAFEKIFNMLKAKSILTGFYLLGLFVLLFLSPSYTLFYFIFMLSYIGFIRPRLVGKNELQFVEILTLLPILMVPYEVFSDSVNSDVYFQILIGKQDLGVLKVLVFACLACLLPFTLFLLRNFIELSYQNITDSFRQLKLTNLGSLKILLPYLLVMILVIFMRDPVAILLAAVAVLFPIAFLYITCPWKVPSIPVSIPISSKSLDFVLFVSHLLVLGYSLHFLFYTDFKGFETFVQLWMVLNFSILGIIFLIKYGYNSFIDLKTSLRIQSVKVERKIFWERIEIQKHAESFRTSYFQSRFINYLDHPKILVLGFWTQGQLPKLKSTKASINLAKLEEKWLGFDKE
ncbi:MAG: hypothetical protein F6K19_17345 [Cyanothece sp. SIO1E1]|nr:hypothetical protein [Cyanothece sp. SIO1E1]